MSGGAKGIRDHGLLESAIARPYQTFGGEDLYPSAFHKAAAILESILKNHPFIDGNKRTALVVMRTFLALNDVEFVATQEEKYLKILGLAEGSINEEDLAEWIRSKSS